MMTTIRPNVRRITSPQTIARVQWDILTIWLTAIGINIALWAAFFSLIAN